MKWKKNHLFCNSFHGRIQIAITFIILYTLTLCMHIPAEKYGVVKIYPDIPRNCATTRGLKQQLVKKVTSEEEMRNHYGLTFLVFFNDGISPPLYGVLYYQNSSENKYCMALPNGEFAIFQDKSIDSYKKNIIHEVCYPLRECIRSEPNSGIKR